MTGDDSGGIGAVIVRRATIRDCARCQEIAVAAWAPIYAERRRLIGDHLFALLHSRWHEDKASEIVRAFRREPLEILVACLAEPAAQGGAQTAGEIIVGFVTYHIDEQRRIGTIGNNAVDPAYQGRGIAQALYHEVLAQFRSGGMRAARVTTGLDAAHAPARAAYRKVGFRLEMPSVTMYLEL